MKTIFPLLTQIGVCTKSFGFKGDIKVGLSIEIKEAHAKPPFVWIKQYGKPVPFAVENLSVLNDNEISLRLEDITEDTQTTSFRNKAIYIETQLLSDYFIPPQLQQDVIDYEVINDKGEHIGKVIAVQEIQKGHPNLIVHTKSEKEIIIPFVAAMITSISDEEKLIEVQLPEGLLDLYL